ncbi:hypothetical protein [Streptomyces sp. NPDC006335]|uniref:hypothetical protein n=1 Tax=Streptomyces sp. NPDC006335 TaxID=3156895 RepID=UPI0033ACF5EC
MSRAVLLSPPEPVPDTRARPGATVQVVGVVVFPVIGGVLAMRGLSVGDVLVLVGGCGVSGAAAIALAGARLAGPLRGRAVGGRLLGAFAAAVRAAQEPRP